MDPRSIQARKDVRTEEGFEREMSKYSHFESIAGYIFQEYLIDIGKITSYTNYGMDNSGKIVFDVSLVNAKPDFKFDIDGKEVKVEMKVHTECFSYLTIKKHCLKTYYRESSSVLIFRETYGFWFAQRAMRYIFKHIQPEWHVPFGMSYRLYLKDIKVLLDRDFMKKLYWTPRIRKIIEENSFIFDKKKKYQRRKKRKQK